jgi:hypothetical protein
MLGRRSKKLIAVLLYILDMSLIEQNIAKQAVQSGAPIPERIANAPELINGLQIYLQAFFDLDSERNHGFSLSAIPWQSIKEYAETYEFDAEQKEDLLFFIRRMDQAHLDRLDKKQPKPGKGKK